VIGLRLQDPFWLLLLIPLLVLGLLAIRRQRRTSVLFSDVSILKTLPATFWLRVKNAMPWVWIIAIALAIIALARPQFGREEFRVRTEGIAMEMCIDRSGSMQAMDFEIDGKRVNRLDAVKKVFYDFVLGQDSLPGRPDDQIGLIAFGGFADAKCPLTLDHNALLQMLKAIKIPQPIHDAKGQIINARLLEEELATAIGDAVVLGIDRLKDAKAKSKVIILLSDGKSNAGLADPAAAAEAAKAFGIKIYTIGVGSTGMAPFPATDRLLIRQQVELDEATLRMLADATGGKYFNAKDTQTLKNVYAEIDKLEKTPSEGRIYTEYRELYKYAMLPGLGLILLVLVVTCTKFRSLP